MATGRQKRIPGEHPEQNAGGRAERNGKRERRTVGSMKSIKNERKSSRENETNEDLRLIRYNGETNVPGETTQRNETQNGERKQQKR